MPLIRRDAQPDATPAPPDDPTAMLAAGTTDQRWLAARDLAATPGGEDALARALPGEADPRVRDAIFTGLVRRGGPIATDALVAALRSDDAALRTGALDALAALPDAAADRLPDLLADADPDIRLYATELARARPTPDAARLLCGLIEGEPRPNVCAAAIEVLAEIGGPEALPALDRCAARFRSEPFLRFAVDAARQRIGAGRPGHGG